MPVLQDASSPTPHFPRCNMNLDERTSIYKHCGRDGTWAVYVKFGRYGTMEEADRALSRVHAKLKPHLDALLRTGEQQ